MTKDSLREPMGMVLQDTWLFEGTIAENLAFGREGAERSEIIAAAEATGGDQMIRMLPLGYDTPVSDDGGSISAREKQLLTYSPSLPARPRHPHSR
ncbi:hypothetical protein [Actinobaculum sp. 313]|nr:hypothetical protein [Actinobaculum sp. 313]